MGITFVGGRDRKWATVHLFANRVLYYFAANLHEVALRA